MLHIPRNHSFSPAALEAIIECLRTPSTEGAIGLNTVKKRFVYPLDLDGRRLVGKLYIHQTLPHRIGAWAGLSYADRYLMHARTLVDAGYRAPRPVGVFKEGRGLLPERSLLVMERVDGEEIRHVLGDIESDADRIREIAPQIAHLIKGLWLEGISHRDLNTKNFLVDGNAVALIDLDSASQHAKGSRTLNDKHRRDVQTFLNACRSEPRFAAAVTEELRKLGDLAD